jgi:hypothetical protein
VSRWECSGWLEILTHFGIENFHLFLSTPNCHAIFVAACLDNGFARMLEQYSDHALAREKIVLVSPGFMAFEIQNLGLREVQWPRVFAQRTATPEVLLKQKKHDKRVESLKGRMQRSLSTPMVSNVRDRPILPQLLEMVPTWDVNAAVNKLSGGVGLRSLTAHTATVRALDLAETEEEDVELD